MELKARTAGSDGAGGNLRAIPNQPRVSLQEVQLFCELSFRLKQDMLTLCGGQSDRKSSLRRATLWNLFSKMSKGSRSESR